MLVPFSNRVVLIADAADDKTKAGLYIPGSAQEKPQTATVEAIGDDVKLPLKKGDKVVYKEYSTTLIKEDKKEYLLIEDADILAKVS